MSIDINPGTTGVTSLNGLSGTVTVAAGVGATVQTSGTTITVTTPPISLFTKTVYNGNRVIGTTYQNTTGFPVIVNAAIQPGSTIVTAVCDASATPTTVVGEQLNVVNTANSGIPISGVSFLFIVPNNDFYKISGTGATTIGWTEWTINSGSVGFSGELSGSRALSTVYQNTSGFAMLVAADLSGVTSGTVASGLSDSNPAPSAIVWQSTTPVSSAHTMVWMVVPNTHYYEVTCSGAAVAHWNEYTLPFNATKSTDLLSARGVASIGTAAANAFAAPSWTNTTARDMFVTVSETSVTTSAMKQNAKCAASPMPNITLALQQFLNNNSGGQCSVIMLVQPGESYMVGHDSGTITGEHWWEYQLA